MKKMFFGVLVVGLALSANISLADDCPTGTVYIASMCEPCDMHIDGCKECYKINAYTVGCSKCADGYTAFNDVCWSNTTETPADNNKVYAPPLMHAKNCLDAYWGDCPNGHCVADSEGWVVGCDIYTCDKGCSSCDYDGCTACDTGYKLENGACVSDCPTNCSSCTSGDSCDTCAGGYINKNGSCITADE